MSRSARPTFIDTSNGWLYTMSSQRAPKYDANPRYARLSDRAVQNLERGR